MEANLAMVQLGETEVYRWKKPPVNFVKINVDAAFFYLTGGSKSRMMARDLFW